MSAEWRFFDYRDGETLSNSAVEKLLLDSDMATVLIRESVQNSIDARLNEKGPTQLKIHEKEMEMKLFLPYFSSLQKHLKACNILEDFKGDTLKFLIFEDFGTTGLMGNKKESFLRMDNKRNDEGPNSGGSHGGGKKVFYMASKIKTIFVYSIFNNNQDNESYLEGRCALKTHSIENVNYREYGDLALQDQNIAHLLFKRENQQTGLSIAIPFFDSEELSQEKIREAIYSECYLPVVQGLLSVDAFGKTIDNNSILEHSDERLQLITDYQTSSKHDVFINIPIGKYKQNGYKKIEQEYIDEIAGYLKKDDRKCQIECEIEVLHRKDGKKPGRLTLLIRESEEPDQEYKIDFWRHHLLISEARKNRSKSVGYIIIVIIDGKENPLAQLLRQLENVAHTTWQYKNLSQKVKDGYGHIADIVNLTTRLPGMIISGMSHADEELDKSFFSNYFSGKALPKGPNLTPDRPDISIPPSGGQEINIVRSNDNQSYTISLRKRTIDAQHILAIKLAYGISRGNAFKKYTKSDFDLTNISTKITEGSISYKITEGSISYKITEGSISYNESNIIRCAIKSNDFKLILSGFDVYRELVVDAKLEDK